MSASSGDAGSVELIYATSDSRAAGLQRWSLISLLVGFLLLWLLGSHGALWVVGTVLSLIAVSFWWMGRSLMRPGRPVFRLTPTHLEGALVEKRHGGPLAWADLEDVELRSYQGAGALVFSLWEGERKKRFWTGMGGNQFSVPLTMLNEEAQQRLAELIRARLPQRSHCDQTEWNEIQAEQALRDRLKALAPTPWLTWGLVVVNGVIWALTDFADAGLKSPTAEQLLMWGGNAASEVQRGEWWRLLSATFLHNGLVHLLMNMVGLVTAGVMVERIYGRPLFGLIYVGAGLCGSALSLHFSAQTAVSVGASGAVFGVTGALLVAVLQHRERLPASFGRDTIMGVGTFIFYALVQGFAKEGVDNAAHVGGLLGGALLAWMLPERFDLEHYRRTWRKAALLALAVAVVLVAGLTLSAPAARIDQVARVQYQKNLERAAAAFDKQIAALAEEEKAVKEGRVTARELDVRSRTVHAPAWREVVALVEAVQMPPGDPRYPRVQNMKRIAELLAESMAMESYYPDPEGEPQPVDPHRMDTILKELRLQFERFKEAGKS